jgi:7-cyano-7-deazaguanine synthase
MKAVVLLSGGMDSAVALWWAKKKGWSCHALSFDYGQRHKKELRRAALLAKRAKVPIQFGVFALPWSKSTLTKKKSALPHRSLAKIHKIPSTYVPGRNTVFLSFAMSYADQIGARAIVIGANAIDYSGYPDCRPRYLKAFEKTATLGSKHGVEDHQRMRVVAPLLKLTKADIVRLGRKLNVPLDLTWSCYAGTTKPCGVCDSCQLRDKGFREARQSTGGQAPKK